MCLSGSYSSKARPRLLVACEFSGIVRDAFRAKGIDAVSCDLLPSERSGPHIQDDVLNHLNEGWAGVIGHPSCTDTAVSGARWFKEKKEKQKAAIGFFMRLWNAPVEHIALEQPVSIMSTAFRKPDQIVQPWQFGHGETKATCLWLKNLPLLKPTNIVEGRAGRIWREPPSLDRWKNRSRTYQGIAEAFAAQWSPALFKPESS